MNTAVVTLYSNLNCPRKKTDISIILKYGTEFTLLVFSSDFFFFTCPVGAVAIQAHAVLSVTQSFVCSSISDFVLGSDVDIFKLYWLLVNDFE